MNLHEKTFCGTSGNKSKVNYAFQALYFAIPVAWNTQILPTKKKRQDIEMTKLFAHSEKNLWPLIQYVRIYIYMYIGRFIIWHMLWCTLILPFFRLFLITSLTFPHSQRNTSYVRLDTVGHWWPVRTWRMGHSDIPFFKQPWWYLETTSEKT